MMKKLFILSMLLTYSYCQNLTCIFTDLNGDLKGLEIPKEEIKGAFKRGLTFDGSSVAGCTNINQSDLLLRLDDNSLRKSCKDQLIFCDICLDQKNNFYACSRSYLKSIISQIKNVTGADLLCGAEIEFYLLDKNDEPVDSYGYFSLNPCKEIIKFSKKALKILIEYGIKPEKFHHEVAPGQFEISLKYDNALKIADDIILTRFLLEKLAKEFGYKAVFTPKPFKKYNGSGMHIHFSLNRDGKNIFSNDNGDFSEIGFQFIAGVLKHIKNLSILTNYTRESYQRLVPGFEAPILVCWGQKNRSALIRQPIFQGESIEEINRAVRAEIRNPDCQNAYLTLSAIGLAGYNGIVQKLNCPEQINKSLYNINEKQLIDMGIDSLPKDFDEALYLFKETVIEGLSSEFKKHIIDLKTKK